MEGPEMRAERMQQEEAKLEMQDILGPKFAEIKIQAYNMISEAKKKFAEIDDTTASIMRISQRWPKGYKACRAFEVKSIWMSRCQPHLFVNPHKGEGSVQGICISRLIFFKISDRFLHERLFLLEVLVMLVQQNSFAYLLPKQVHPCSASRR